MGGKKPATNQPIAAISPLAKRIVVLAKLIWGSNISRMSNAIGTSHPVLSRVLRGKQDPPGKLLEALARWPGINVRWLFAAEGDPLNERHLGAGGGRFCPISDQLLPGPPAEHPELLTWASLPAADALYSETAYWYRVPVGQQIIREKSKKVGAGDYLLVETGDRWTRKWGAVHGRICALIIKTLRGQEMILGEVDPYEDPIDSHHLVNTFGLFPKTRLFLDKSSIGEAPKAAREEVIDLNLSNVIGVCILLNRIL